MIIAVSTLYRVRAMNILGNAMQINYWDVPRGQWVQELWCENMHPAGAEDDVRLVC
jgi:hypothetical protein